MKFKYFLLMIFTVMFINVSSQEPLKYKSISHDYNTAMELYNNKMYGAAQKMFAHILLSDEKQEHSSYNDDAAFYIAMCAIHLTNKDAEYLIKEFIEETPESYNKQTAILEKADFHFRNRRYRNAIEWYEKVDKITLTRNEQTEYHFKVGFSHFARKDFERAATSFYEVKDVKSTYGYMSLYFYSHIKYLNKEYQTALYGFLELVDNPLFKEIVPFYIVQIYYLQERYNELVEYASTVFDSISDPRTIETIKLIGSSHFKLENYSEAIPYLRIYDENAARTTDSDNYELGFALYMSRRYVGAISYFSKIVSMRDTISQNAAYHMADCFLKLNRKKEAKLAFETASRYGFNEAIREDALFNYAQLSFELDINPFNEGINALTKYINMYPNSHRIDLVYGFLIDAFWSSKNYKDAIVTIEKMQHRSPKLDEAYQRLTYYRGLEYFTTLKFNEAIKHFDKSLKYGKYNVTIRALCLYWKADAYYRIGNYRKAISDYEEFISTRGALSIEEFDHAHYNLGYAYYNLKDYSNAGMWFRKFEMQSKDKKTVMHNDALNRIGDCYYIARNFSPAANYYKKSSQMGMIDADYALYQMALSYGGLKLSQQKAWSLSRLLREYPNSEYAANSCYEVGRTYNAELNNPDSAKYYFNLLLKEYPNSAMKKHALANLGAIYFSDRDFNNSLENFKNLIAQYPNTGEASNAAEMIKSIYIEMNKAEEYFKYAETELEGVEITIDEQDSISFLVAKNFYIEEKFPQALEALTKYLNRFPGSRNAIEAHFYKAELHYHFEEKEEALRSYLIIADCPRGVYSEKSTLRASGLLYEKEDYDRALVYYNKLYDIAENKNNRHIAAIGKLRSAYLSEKYDEVIHAAVDVIENDRSNQEQKREAYYKMAKAHYAEGRKIRALSLFEDIAKETTSFEGAESKYRVAEINYKMNNDSIAEEIIYEFAKMNSPQQYWVGKSFILLADIFYDRTDNFSAKHTLQSVLNNYPDEIDGIKDIASNKLTAIIDEEQEIKLTEDFLELELDILKSEDEEYEENEEDND